MVNTASIKTIVVDLDRTLLHTDKTLSAHTVKVFEKCKRCGMKIIVATARPFRDAKQYCAMIDADAVVVSNGARIIYNDKRTDYGIDLKSAERLLKTLKCYPTLRITVETGTCAYSNFPISDYETILSDDLIGISGDEGVLKILVHLDNEKTLALVKNELSDDLYYTIAHGYLMQIMNISATKWNGIKAVLNICNCSANETIYFGDDQDDIEPIKMCGIGVAVSNGIDEAKDAADYIAESNDHDGVAEFLAHRILKNL